jgi:hypothetical protein
LRESRAAIGIAIAATSAPGSNNNPTYREV